MDECKEKYGTWNLVSRLPDFLLFPFGSLYFLLFPFGSLLVDDLFVLVIGLESVHPRMKGLNGFQNAP